MEIIAFWSANIKLHAANTKIPFQNRATLLAQALLRLIQSPPSGTLDPNQLETHCLKQPLRPTSLLFPLSKSNPGYHLSSLSECYHLPFEHIHYTQPLPSKFVFGLSALQRSYTGDKMKRCLAVEVFGVDIFENEEIRK